MFDEKFSRRDFIKKTSAAALALTATNFLIKDVHAAEPCRIRTRYGIYNGFVDKRGVQTWLGIPYAKPPVGNLRWHAPEPLEPSNKEFNAKKFGFSPLQDRDPVEPASMLKKSEDCLTLNIWRRSSKKNQPVMIFIPGGGFVNGGSGDPLYNGANLAASHDVIIVTINYRLNIFGFMNFSVIDSAFEDTGYLGIKDQVAALKWIKENISEFGGDPDNVTIFGESAGSISTMLLMVTPAAQGLFNKVIAQSGHLAFYHVHEKSSKLAEEFMNFGGYKSMSELMKMPAKKLNATYVKFTEKRELETEVDYFPTCDGKYLPLHPLRDLKDGVARDIKLLTGTTAAEYLYWAFYFEGILEELQQYHAILTPILYEGEFLTAKELYQSWEQNHLEFEDIKRYVEFANQLDWRVGHELAAEYQSAFDDVYFYLFSQESPIEGFGSCHAIDLPFVFNNPNKELEPNPDAKLVKQIQAAWCSFAASGNPNNDLIPTWKKYTAADRETMEMNLEAWTLHKDLNTENLTELRGVYEDHLLD